MASAVYAIFHYLPYFKNTHPNVFFFTPGLFIFINDFMNGKTRFNAPPQQIIGIINRERQANRCVANNFLPFFLTNPPPIE